MINQEDIFETGIQSRLTEVYEVSKNISQQQEEGAKGFCSRLKLFTSYAATDI